MHMKNLLKEKLEKKNFVLGAFVASCSPTNVEILGMNGLDFVILDMEHSPLGLETMVDMIRAAEAYGMVAIPRVYTIETKLMRRVLDVGAHGLLVPMVNTMEDAHCVIDAVKFPPLGARGMNAGRGPRWGGYEDYIRQANDALFTMFQCETREGLQNVEEIARLEAVEYKPLQGEPPLLHVKGGQSHGVDGAQSGVRHQQAAQAAGTDYVGQPQFLPVKPQGAEESA